MLATICAVTSGGYAETPDRATPWSPATKGALSAEVVAVPTLKEEKDLDAWKGKLAGKILITDVNQPYQQSFKPDATRYTDEQLDSMSKVVIKPVDTAELRRRREALRRRARRHALSPRCQGTPSRRAYVAGGPGAKAPGKARQ